MNVSPSEKLYWYLQLLLVGYTREEAEQILEEAVRKYEAKGKAGAKQGQSEGNK